MKYTRVQPRRRAKICEKRKSRKKIYAVFTEKTGKDKESRQERLDNRRVLRYDREQYGVA